MVLAGAGGVDHNELVKLAGQHFPNVKTDMDVKIPDITASRFTGTVYIYILCIVKSLS